jgi:hypothetical protein
LPAKESIAPIVATEENADSICSKPESPQSERRDGSYFEPVLW